VLLAAGEEDVSSAVRVSREAGVRIFPIGLGSNVLLPDEGLEALVLRIGKGLDAVESDGPVWRFGAGLPAPLAARKTAEAGWAGLHVMVGVPGSVGGGVYMNAGCHGGEWADVVRAVDLVDSAGERRRVKGLAPFALDDVPILLGAHAALFGISRAAHGGERQPLAQLHSRLIERVHAVPDPAVAGCQLEEHQQLAEHIGIDPGQGEGAGHAAGPRQGRRRGVLLRTEEPTQGATGQVRERVGGAGATRDLPPEPLIPPPPERPDLSRRAHSTNTGP